MKSIKQGRGPSAMGGVGAVVAVVFGIIWTIGASQMSRMMGDFGGDMVGFTGIFPLFGVVFILAGIAMAIYHFRNASRDAHERTSLYDIVDTHENEKRQQDGTAQASRFCTQCGAPVQESDVFCAKCGQKIQK